MTTPSTSSAPDPTLDATPVAGVPTNGTPANGTPVNGSAGSTSRGSGGTSERYEVMERAGEGTMWVCYRVRDRASGTVRALKALKGTFARHPKFPPALLMRLSREALLRLPSQPVRQAAGQTSGASLLALAEVYESGLEEGTPYFITEWVPNNTLESLLDRSVRKPLSRTQMLAIMRALSQALDLLHTNGMAHGDVRPRQVRLLSDGTPRLGDASHATALHEAGVQLTDVIGDAAFYQAPERWDNRAPSPAADLYALGIILYRMLAGRVPFEGTSPLSVAMRHRRDLPMRPSQFNAQCPPDLERIAMRLLEKEPQSRYASAAHLLRDLTVAPPSAAPTTPGAAAPANTSDDAPLDAALVASLGAPAAALLDDEDDEDAQAERVRRRKHRRREFWGMLGAFVWMLAIGAGLGGMVLGAYRFWMADIPNEVSVPEYRGKSQEAVTKILAKKGLKFRIAREVYDPRRPSGTVLSGEPPPGKKVRSGREVAATVSRGPEPIRMYDFSELTLQQVRAVVVRDGLRLGSVMEQYHDTIPAGYICGQFPEPGEAFRRTEPINVVVSRGAQPNYDAQIPNGVPPLAEPTTPPETRDEPLVPLDADGGGGVVQRVVQVRVAIPADASSQEVRVIAKDADGERTVYRKTHQPGEVVQENVQVTRAQGATALVRIYVGGSLVREIRV